MEYIPVNLNIYEFYKLCEAPVQLQPINFDNYFEFDMNFFIQANNIISDNPCKYYHDIGIEKQMIFHPKQIKTFYKTSKIILIDNKINVKLNDTIYLLNDFCQRFIYDIKLEYFLNNYELIYDNLYPNKLLIIFHINNIDIAKEMLIKQQMLNSSIICTFSCTLDNEFNELIKEKFNSCCLLKIDNYGNDIIPSFISYNFAYRKFNYSFR